MILRILQHLLVTFVVVFGYNPLFINADDQNVMGIVGGNVSIPCKLDLQNKPIDYILWYNMDSRDKLYYSVDWNSDTQAHVHTTLSDAWGDRATFRIDDDPPNMLVERLVPEDTGVYQCIVYYTDSPLDEYISNLTVITPPSVPQIVDSLTNEVIQDQTIPYKMGETISLVCVVKGAWPAPSVLWYDGSLEVPSEVTGASKKMVNSSVSIGPLTREHRDMELKCEASNSNIGPIKNKSIKLNVIYKPESVSVEFPPSSSPQVVGVDTLVMCSSWGAKPSAILTWWIGEEQLAYKTADMTTDSGNVSISQLGFIARREDYNKSLTCKAHSHEFNLTLEDTKPLDVQFSPEINLVAASGVEVEEGGEIILECTITANPEPNEIFWYYDKYRIDEDSNTSTKVISNITRSESGMYTCGAENDVGQTTSDPVVITVNYIPQCVDDEAKVIGVTLDEEVSIPCVVKSSPSEVVFRWQLISIDGSILDIPLEEYTAEDSKSSLKFTLRDQNDVGQLLCYFENEIGSQEDPCVFDLVEANIPEVPENCTVANYTHTSITIACIPGYNGGLTQTFSVFVFDRNTSLIVMSYEFEEPVFSLENLPSNAWFEISVSARNSKGRSKNLIVLQAATPYAMSSEIVTKIFPITPILGVLIGIVGALVVVAVVVVVIMKLRSSPKTHKSPPPQKAKVVQSTLHASVDEPVNTRTDTEYEDVEAGIPQKLKHANLYETVTYDNPGEAPKAQEEKDVEGTMDVEYTELLFKNGKAKKKQPKITKGKKKVKVTEKDDTTYAAIDHVKTAQQYQEKQKKKSSDTKPPVVPSSENLPLMTHGLESSV